MMLGEKWGKRAKGAGTDNSERWMRGKKGRGGEEEGKPVVIREREKKKRERKRIAGHRIYKKKKKKKKRVRHDMKQEIVHRS